MYKNYTKDVKKLFFYNIRCMDTHDHDESMTDVCGLYKIYLNEKDVYKRVCLEFDHVGHRTWTIHKVLLW